MVGFGAVMEDGVKSCGLGAVALTHIGAVKVCRRYCGTKGATASANLWGRCVSGQVAWVGGFMQAVMIAQEADQRGFGLCAASGLTRCETLAADRWSEERRQSTIAVACRRRGGLAAETSGGGLLAMAHSSFGWGNRVRDSSGHDGRLNAIQIALRGRPCEATLKALNLDSI